MMEIRRAREMLKFYMLWPRIFEDTMLIDIDAKESQNNGLDVNSRNTEIMVIRHKHNFTTVTSQ